MSDCWRWAGPRPKSPMKANITEYGFPIVCVGGSAGKRCLCPIASPFAAGHGCRRRYRQPLRKIVATQLHEILPRYTEMPVELITEGMVIGPTTFSSSHLSAICMSLTGRFGSNRFPNQGAGRT